MEFELKIRGTPAMFATMVDTLDTQLWLRHKDNIWSQFNNNEHINQRPRFDTGDIRKISPDTNSTKVRIFAPNVKSWVFITANRTPDEKTLLVVYAEDEYWNSQKEYWELLYDELERQGWIVSPNNVQFDSIDKRLEFNKSGRPSDPDFDEAYKRISSGKDYAEVYLWCCKIKELEDDKYFRKSFKQAMKRREAKESTN